ncbi:MFS transporter [Paenibacillus sp. FSL H8-0259]|uniref:MFS transporter n=1 Tax=Paenibacillus sp. FSL H8-0259 TaxID=1920423 RepID=UPI00096F85EA|nr:MFS transporter [Paenibacillus sp. FSL H8-0259]OMF30295.1 MFS transporter [Paenibacillus sp. FSL H8-0259]
MKHAATKSVPSPGKERFPLSLLVLTLGAFAIGMTEFIIMGLLPNVASDLGVTISQAGQLITSYALGVAIGAPVLTVFTHRLPQKKLLVILMGIFIFGNAVSVIAPTYPLLIIARVLTAFAHGTFLGQQLGWRASFGAITVLGIISLFGIIRFIPVIVQEQTANLAEQVRGLMNPKVLLILLTGALGCGSLFALFTYITPILEDITGFAEHSVTWILVLFGVGVTLGNIAGGKLADWKLMPSLIVNFAVLAGIIALFPLTLHHPVLAVANVFLWGIAAFGIMPGIQLRIMNLAHKAPLLATTSSHSALNLGNAAGAYLGGVTINTLGIATIPWLASGLAVLALCGAWLSYRSTRANRAEHGLAAEIGKSA